MEAATGTFGNGTCYLLLVEAGAAPDPDDRFIIDALGKDRPVLLIINKNDLAEKSGPPAPHRRLPGPLPLRAIIPLSALKADGLEVLLKELWDLLPEGRSIFPRINDGPVRRFTPPKSSGRKHPAHPQGDPLRHGRGVDAFQEQDSRNLIRITATIHVAKERKRDPHRPGWGRC